MNLARSIGHHREAGSAPVKSASGGGASLNQAQSMAILLTLMAVIPYAPTLMNGFVYDDDTQVLNNPYIQNFHHLREIFTTTVWSYIGAQGVTNYYRPIMTLGYLLCHELFGRVAFGYHLVNVLLHAGVVLLLFGVTARLFSSHRVAFVASALFALHPAHTESVAWIAAVTDLELAFFFLLTFWCFLAVARPEGKRSERYLAAMAVSFVLALLSKEQAMMLPPLATVYEHFYRPDRHTTTPVQKASRYGVLWLLALAYVLFRIRFLGALAPVTQISTMTWWQVMLSAAALTGQYVFKLLWPARLCAFYVFEKTTCLAQPRALAGVATLAALAGLLAYLSRRKAVACFGLLWFAATLAPVLNARWMAANVFAERYLYLPSVGFCWLAGWAGVLLWERAALHPPALRSAVAVVAACVALACALRIVVRDQDWSNDIRLYTRTLKQSPHAYHILNNLGTIYWDQGELDQAAEQWRRALQLAPHNVIILNNLGLYYAKQKQYDRAIQTFRRAMLLKPIYTAPHLNLGSTYQKVGRTNDAILQLRAAAALSPLDVHAHNELGKIYFGIGQWAQAQTQFQLSAASEPNPLAYVYLGNLLARRGDAAQALLNFHRALKLNPFDSKARFGMARVLMASGKNQQALAEFKAGLQTDPANAEARAAVERLKGLPGVTPHD